MIDELLLIHHSHTDIGYTHPQPVIFELHHRFIEMALDLADAGADEREDTRFRWTCEITGTTRAWWEAASPTDRDRFLAAVRRGQIEVAAMEWHFTPLADLRMIIRSLENVQFFRDLGVPVRSAMNTDVNGVPWGLVDVLLDHGIDGFSMASNSHFGAPVHPRPGAFKWAAPSGREITVWNGFQYWHAANVLLHMPDTEGFAEALPDFIRQVEANGYPHSFLPLQITNPHHHPDNATPDATLSAFVRNWNDQSPSVRLRTVLLSDVFDRLREESLPTLSGDWTDYWNFGAGSSARETATLAEGLRTLDAAHQVSAWPGIGERREKLHLDAAHEGLALYAEHTWGADRSVFEPESLETRTQWAGKSVYVFQGLGHARIVLRDGLNRLAERAGGEEPSLLLYNSLPIPVQTQALLPTQGLEWATNPGVHHLQRLDGSLSDLPESMTRWSLVDVPAFGYRTYPLSDLPLLSADGLEITESGIRSDRISLSFGEDGGIQSAQLDGKEFGGASGRFRFGVPLLERPAGGSRRDIMKLDFQQLEPADGWVENWEKTTEDGKLNSQRSRVTDGCVEHLQEFEMANGDTVSVTYRLFAGDPTIDVLVSLHSAGDAKPYSLALPFVLPETPEKTWHFDTAGAVVEFDREQLPNAARHYVTARRFVRMQTENAALSIATPDLPLWMFGDMNMAPSTALRPSDRSAVTLAWLANNYWEVNFLANQTGRTQYRLRLIPHAPESIEKSVRRALPYTVPIKTHAYRGLGERRTESESLLQVFGDDVTVDALVREGEDLRLVCTNLRDTVTEAKIPVAEGSWQAAHRSFVSGTPYVSLPVVEGHWLLRLEPRETVGVRLTQA